MTDLKTNFKARIILKEDLSTEEVAYIESKISNLAEKYDMYRHADGITYSKREPYKGLDDFHAGIAFCVSLNKKEYRNYFSAIYSYSYLEGVRYNAITNESILMFKNVEQEESEDLSGLESVLEDAIEIAVRFHKGQKDKNNEPYILHSLRVMMNCSSHEEKIVAVLHDVLEDTSCTEAYLEGVLESDRLLNAIKAITRYPDEKYFDYICRLKNNELARKVKIADLIDNVSRVGASGSLRKRYYKALGILCDINTSGDKENAASYAKILKDDWNRQQQFVQILAETVKKEELNLDELEFVAECKETNERVAFTLGDLYGWDDETIYLDTSIYFENEKPKKLNWDIIICDRFARRMNPEFNVHIRSSVDVDVIEPIKLISCRKYNGYYFSARFSDGVTRTGCLSAAFKPWNKIPFYEDEFRLAEVWPHGLKVKEDFVAAKTLLEVSKEYVHCGCTAEEYSAERFQKVRNIPHSTKPFGGFWASPFSRLAYGWEWFCKQNEYYRKGESEKKFAFCLDVDANVFRIETVADFRRLPMIETAEETELIDFEECRRQGIDAIEYDYSTSHVRWKFDKRYTEEDGEELDKLLLGWDCDSIIILNPKIIVQESIHTVR